MQYILILRELSEQEDNRVRSLESHKDVVIVTTPSLFSLYKNSIIYKELSEEEKKKINYETLSQILEFGDTVVNGDTISKHFNFDGAALWYYHKFRIYFKVRNLRYELEEINKNLGGATSAIIYTENKSLRHFNFAIDKMEIIASSPKNRHSLSFWSVIQYGFVAIIRFIKSILTPISGFKNKQFLCIDTVNQYRNILSLDGQTTIFENAYLGYLYQKMGDQFGFIDQLLIPKFSGEDRYKFHATHLLNHNNRNRILGERIMTGGLFSLKVIMDIIRTKKELKTKYQLISKAIENHPVKRQILNEFIKLNSTSIFYLFKFFSYRKFFRKRNFSSILTTDENSPNFKIILDAAKQNEIFTLGYQHGSIHELHPAYIYTKADLSQKPMPDLTITWGNKWKKLLISTGNYTPEMVGIAGQIRTDVIKNLKENREINKETVFPVIGQKYIILFATQPQRDQSLRHKAAEDVVLACKNIKSANLVFKLHPRENDPKYYIDIAEKHHLKNYTISQEEDLYILLKISDIVITCFSTVGTEALYFGKPLIILDHLKQDILKYHKDGVAFQAANANELANFIDEILSGNSSINQQVLEEYILDSTYKIDGNAAERFMKMIKR